MPIEVKNLSIRVQINGQKNESSKEKSQKQWTSKEVMQAIEQTIYNLKER